MLAGANKMEGGGANNGTLRYMYSTERSKVTCIINEKQNACK